MGQTLSEPVVEKHSTDGGDSRVVYGASEMQGWRITMEDAHTTIPNLEGTGTSFFAVFDGHGGAAVAKYCGQFLHKKVLEESTFSEKQYEDALRDGFLKTDQDLREDKEFANDSSGCTAVVALITADNHVFVSNAGDSRAVISIHGKCKPLSYDHKPVNRTESSRIVAAGGFVEFGRVNGNLALSRALGDFEFKQNNSLPATEQIVTANPDIIEHTLGDEDEFMIIACDGIWDCKTNQEAVDFVRAGLGQRKSLKAICEELMDDCLAPNSEIGGVGCDNMTVIIVGILNGKSENEWRDWMVSRCQTAVAKKAEQDEAKRNQAEEEVVEPNAVIDLKNVGLTYEADNEELQVVSDADKKAAEKQIREDTTLQASDNTNQ
ncbi:phosphatase 2C-like domain-containing protein [Umbelopsis sp. PMI_123]|nr:phosphatase 2C-like domain-containing protein [Umbelopsis sp. PMI_123]